MKNYLLTIKSGVGLLLVFLLSSVYAFAQNASDSDLSNVADSNKSWREGWWLIALVILLVFIVWFAYRRKKPRQL